MLVYGECECFVMQMLYACVVCASCGSSQCCILHGLQFVKAGRGCNRRPYRRGSKRHSLQAVELSQRTQADLQIVSNPPAPSNGGPIYRFGHTGWLVLLLTKAGDVEINPGPTTLNKRVWICDICHKQIHVRKQISIRCNRIEHWVHLRCAGNRQVQYTDTWTCHLHRESRLTPHTDITPSHRSRPWSKPPTHLHHRNQNTRPTLPPSPQDW